MQSIIDHPLKDIQQMHQGSPVIQNRNWKRHKIAEGCNPSIFLIEDAINHRLSSERYSTNASGPVV
jgi:hypothetical protein